MITSNPNVSSMRLGGEEKFWNMQDLPRYGKIYLPNSSFNGVCFFFFPIAHEAVNAVYEVRAPRSSCRYI